MFHHYKLTCLPRTCWQLLHWTTLPSTRSVARTASARSRLSLGVRYVERFSVISARLPIVGHVTRLIISCQVWKTCVPVFPVNWPSHCFVACTKRRSWFCIANHARVLFVGIVRWWNTAVTSKCFCTIKKQKIFTKIWWTGNWTKVFCHVFVYVSVNVCSSFFAQ